MKVYSPDVKFNYATTFIGNNILIGSATGVGQPAAKPLGRFVTVDDGYELVLIVTMNSVAMRPTGYAAEIVLAGVATDFVDRLHQRGTDLERQRSFYCQTAKGRNDLSLVAKS